MTFVLDHRLAGESSFIEDWDLCRVLLKNDKSLPWLYLVPRRMGVREIYELSSAEQQHLIHEIGRAAKALDVLYQPDKINTAALGNMVPQLHVHIFGRYKTDPVWPRPIWAVQREEIFYTETEKTAEIQKLKDCFKKMQMEDDAA